MNLSRNMEFRILMKTILSLSLKMNRNKIVQKSMMTTLDPMKAMK